MSDVELECTKIEDDAAEAERLRSLLAATELHRHVAFAMLTVGDTVVITTKSTEVTDYERTMYACFAKALHDKQAAFWAGYARGLTEAYESEQGKEQSEWTGDAIDRLRDALESATKAQFTANTLTRVAMAPFGLTAMKHDNITLWTTPAEVKKAEESE